MSKSIKKFLAIGILASSIMALNPTGVNAEWKQNLDNTWSYDNISNGWLKEGQSWYFFKNDVMKTGWVLDNEKWYYLNSNGTMVTNTEINGYKIDKPCPHTRDFSHELGHA